MTEVDDEHGPLWLPPISLVAIVLALVLISFTPSFLSPSPLLPFSSTGQLLLLFILLRAFCYWPPTVRLLARMPGPHRTVFILILVGMVLGHATIRSSAYFPFIPWEIFPAPDERDPVTCREFIATTSSGKKVRLLAEQLFPSIVQINRLNTCPLEKTGHLARALALVYNEHHPDDPLKRVDLVELAVKLHPPATEWRAQPSCELLQRYTISSGQ